MPFILRRFGPIVVAWIALTAPAFSASLDDLMNMADKFDQMDRMDLGDALKKADECTIAREFDCSDAELARARKFVTNDKDRVALARSQRRLADEQEKAAEEARLIARRERDIREAEERLRQAEAQAEREARAAAQDSGGMSTGQALQLFGSLLNQAAQNQMAQRAAAAQRMAQFDRNQSQIREQIERQKQQFARERAELEAKRASLQRQQSAPQVARLQPPVSRPSVPLASASAPMPATARAPADMSQGSLASLGAQRAGIDLAELERDSSSSRSTSGQSAQQQSSAQLQAQREREAQAAADGRKEAQARQAREQETRERQERERKEQAEKAQAERQAKRDAERAAAEQAREAMPKALAFCWQNDKQTLWWCDGPNQEVSLGEKDRSGQLQLVHCENGHPLSRDPLTLTRRRNGASKTGHVFDCGRKLQVGDTGAMTWNRDIRKLWSGIPDAW